MWELYNTTLFGCNTFKPQKADFYRVIIKSRNNIIIYET